jgi:HEAT repeat protein
MTLLLAALTLGLGCRAPATGPEPPILAAPSAVTAEPLPVLADAAGALDVSTRGRALALLIRYDPAPGGGEWGPRALYDPHPYVKSLAVKALADRIQEPESAALLAEVAVRPGVDPYVRGAAAFALAEIGRADLRQQLVDDMAGLTYWQRAPLALAAARMGDEAALEDLKSSLARGEFPLELGFFEDVGRSGLASLAPALIEASTRVEEELVLPIGMALIQLGSGRGESIFRDALSSPDEVLRLEAVDYLAANPAPASDALLNRARAQGPDSVRQYARLVQFSRGQGKVDVAWEALDSDDRESRQLAVRSLGVYLEARGGEQDWRRLERQVHAALLAALDDSEPVVVMEALQAIARAGTTADRVALAPLLSLEAVVLRVEAAGALLALNRG